jgi:hypothetical protein
LAKTQSCHLTSNSLIIFFFCHCKDGDKGVIVTRVEQGGDTDLACDIKIGKTRNSFHWTHQPNPDSKEEPIGEASSVFLTKKLTMVSKKQNYELKSTYKMESFHLKLSNMNPYMQGHYKCYASNDFIREYIVYMKGN